MKFVLEFDFNEAQMEECGCKWDDLVKELNVLRAEFFEQHIKLIMIQP